MKMLLLLPLLFFLPLFLYNTTLAKFTGAPRCEATAIPEISPHVININQSMQFDRCDNRLWGEWDCGTSPLILSHSFDSNGIEQVTTDEESGLFSRTQVTYPVDEKWHPSTHPNRKAGMENATTCGGWNEYGFRVLSILTREAPGLNYGYYADYFVDGNDRLWIGRGELKRDRNGNAITKNHREYSCEREN